MTRTLLIIDDDDQIRRVVELCLRSTWTVIGAADGRSGAQLAKEKQPDLILLDATMPGLDGPASLELLHSDPATAQLPVAFLTGVTGGDERSRLEELGRPIIEKPFSPPELRDEVDLLHAMAPKS